MLDKVDIFIHHIPHLFDTCAVESAVAEHLGLPATVGGREEVEGIAKTGGCHLAFLHVVAVALVDDDAVGYLHDASLDALKFIACACQLYQQEEIHHGVAGRFALAHTHSLYKYLVVACCLAQDDGFTGLAGHTAQ